jgi:Protein of unknown function (DUF4199)
MEEETFTGQNEPAAPAPSFWKSAMSYGLYYGILSIVLSVILYAAGLMIASWVQWISIAIMIAVILLIQMHYRKTIGGFITYGQSLGIAVASMFCASFLIAIFTYILYKFIDPGLIDQINMFTEEKMAQGGKMTQEQIDMAMSFSKKFQTPPVIAISQIFSLPLIGLIIGAISSIFVKKESPDKIFE